MSLPSQAPRGSLPAQDAWMIPYWPRSHTILHSCRALRYRILASTEACIASTRAALWLQEVNILTIKLSVTESAFTGPCCNRKACCVFAGHLPSGLLEFPQELLQAVDTLRSLSDRATKAASKADTPELAAKHRAFAGTLILLRNRCCTGYDKSRSCTGCDHPKSLLLIAIK